jgi:hypothetical protein
VPFGIVTKTSLKKSDARAWILARRTVFFRGFCDGHSATREEEEERASEGRLIEALRLTDFAKTAFGFVKNARNATTVLDV